MRIDLKKLRADLERDEGRRRRPYKCTAGHPSIGVGRNMDDEALPIDINAFLKKNGYITDSMIDRLLDKDIEDTLIEMQKRMPWAAQLDEARQRVMANLLFNMGWGNGFTRLSSFRNTLRAVREGRYYDAAQGMRKSKWYRQVGQRGERLAEAMESGIL